MTLNPTDRRKIVERGAPPGGENSEQGDDVMKIERISPGNHDTPLPFRIGDGG